MAEAITLVLAKKVFLHEDGIATVYQNGGTFEITTECPCPFSQEISKYCVHYVAVEVLKEASVILHVPSNGDFAYQPPPSDYEAVTPLAQPEPWHCAQAPSSCTLKWTLAGIELMLTLRDATDEALFCRIGKVLPKIQAKVEAQRQARQEAKTQPEEDPKMADNNEWCDIHGAPMTRHTKHDDVWYSHKDENGKWCRGK